MAFVFKKSRNPNGGRELMQFTITDASVISEGEAVKLSSGKLVTLGAGGSPGLCLGIVAAIRKADGSPVTDNGLGGRFVGTYTAPTSNTVVAVVDVSTKSVYSVPADATLGTTTGSDKPGYNLDTDATSLTLSESSAASTTASFFSYGPDPDESAASNSVLVSIQESQVKI